MNNSTENTTNIQRYLSICLLTTLLVLGQTVSIAAAAGDLDRSFGNNGFIKTSFPIPGDDMTGSIFQPDGKFIVAGTVSQSGSNLDFYVLRFNSNGSPDSTFGINVTALIAVSPRDDRARGVALQPDGKIIVVGFSLNSSAVYNFAVVRLNENGTPDATFGDNGIVITSVSGTGDAAFDAVVQNDNKIIVCGAGTITDGANFALARYNADGSLDTSFNGNGTLITEFATGSSSAEIVKIQPDGKILAVGTASFGTFSNSIFGFARYHPDGSRDSNFGENGTAVVDVRISEARGNATRDFLIQPDGKIVAVGYSNSGITTGIDFALTRLNNNGTVDATFGINGQIVTPVQGENYDLANTVILQPDGKLLVGSGSNLGNVPDFTVIQYNPDGTLDTKFGNNGIAITQLFGEGASISNIKLEADGRLFAAGVGDFDATFALYQLNGSREVDFDGDKKTDISIFHPSAGEWWYLRSSDDGNRALQFGAGTDRIVPADYTGDGKTDVAVWRESTGEWFILRSEDFSFYSVPFGAAGDISAPGDYDGDGAADYAVFRPSNTTWYVQQSTAGFAAVTFGAAGDQPVPNAFVR